MASPEPVARRDTGQASIWFLGLTTMVALGEGVAWAICPAGVVELSRPTSWAALAAGAAVIGGLGAAVLDRLVSRPNRLLLAEMSILRGKVSDAEAAETQLEGRAESQRRLRHDIRGALSPALLTADRLINHADPKVRRAAEITVKSIERATTLLLDPAEVEPSPPADP